MSTAEPEHAGHDEPERIQPLPTEGLDRYLLHGRRQVRQLLQALIDAHALVSVHLPPGRESFLSALVSLSGDEESLYLDACIDEGTNRRATLADKLMCVTQLDRIRIQFSIEAATLVSLDGRTALLAPVPGQMLRLQRRETYRLQVPLSHEARCAIPRPGDAGSLSVRIIDIGAGGIAFHAAPDALPRLEPAAELPGCLLLLPDLDPITATLEVRNVNPQRNRSGIETLRVGCRFAALPRGADTAIQRYILRTEREINARERGGL
ncbi:flagellar brake protein [Thauera sinica]|uniref:Flagellar brake protein YcgR n=1 Tax=Thauera sinica TaxID=2665146 RepID=A0ABW1APM9_9RHOO|nr:flagellar brake protein [Thauera sp. K11]ATE59430.1 flagellar brake protein [Thauera sp. K11]